MSILGLRIADFRMRIVAKAVSHCLICLKEPLISFTGTAGVPPALSEAKTVLHCTLLQKIIHAAITLRSGLNQSKRLFASLSAGETPAVPVNEWTGSFKQIRPCDTLLL